MQAYFKSVTIKIACNKLHAQLSTGAIVMSFVLFYMSYTVHPLHHSPSKGKAVKLAEQRDDVHGF